MSTPLTPSKLRAWMKYHATTGAYCPAGCGKKFATDEVWAWVLAGTRVYLICRECALAWLRGEDVVPPMGLKNLLETRQWLRFGHGLDLAPGQDAITTYEDPLMKEALELYVRLTAKTCDCGRESAKRWTLQAELRNVFMIRSICEHCAASKEPLGSRAGGLMVSAELACVMKAHIPNLENLLVGLAGNTT